MHGRDELDERYDLAIEDFERLGGDDQGDRAAVPEVLAIGDRAALEQVSHVHVQARAVTPGNCGQPGRAAPCSCADCISWARRGG